MPVFTIHETKPKKDGEKLNIDKDVPTTNAPPLSSPTVNRPKIQAKRLPPTRRPVQNSRLSVKIEREIVGENAPTN